MKRKPIGWKDKISTVRPLTSGGEQRLKRREKSQSLREKLKNFKGCFNEEGKREREEKKISYQRRSEKL